MDPDQSFFIIWHHYSGEGVHRNTSSCIVQGGAGALNDRFRVAKDETESLQRMGMPFVIAFQVIPIPVT